MQESASLEYWLFVFKTREAHTDPFNTEVINFRERKIFCLDIIILIIW